MWRERLYPGGPEAPAVTHAQDASGRTTASRILGPRRHQ